MSARPDFVVAERERLIAAYAQLPLTTTPDQYAPWQPAEILAREQRLRIAAGLLRDAGAFPRTHDHCLEIGFGSHGWLGDLTNWRVPQRNLHGIELDAMKVGLARECFPVADLCAGDATDLPWVDNSFRLVIASTVFSSVLDARVRTLLAAETMRVLAPGGAMLFYDFAVNSPGNPHVRGIGRREIRSLFAGLSGPITSVTLAPPLARLIAPRSWTLATILQAVPLLRTHLLAVLIKP